MIDGRRRGRRGRRARQRRSFVATRVRGDRMHALAPLGLDRECLNERAIDGARHRRERAGTRDREPRGLRGLRRTEPVHACREHELRRHEVEREIRRRALLRDRPGVRAIRDHARRRVRRTRHRDPARMDQTDRIGDGRELADHRQRHRHRHRARDAGRGRRAGRSHRRRRRRKLDPRRVGRNVDIPREQRRAHRRERQLGRVAADELSVVGAPLGDTYAGSQSRAGRAPRSPPVPTGSSVGCIHADGRTSPTASSCVAGVKKPARNVATRLSPNSARTSNEAAAASGSM